MSQQDTIKLTYFDTCGRAESSRLCFTIAGIEFEDNRISPPQWMALKPSTCQWVLSPSEARGSAHICSNTVLTFIVLPSRVSVLVAAGTPTGHLPLLEVNGTVFAESVGIARYAATVSGWQPCFCRQVQQS